MAIQLQQFLNVARGHTVVVNQDNQGGVSLKSGRFEGKTFSPFTTQTETKARSDLNLQTMGLFLNSLQKEYGSDIASHLASKLDITSGSKPLSARVIQNMVGEADAIRKAMTTFNAQSVQDFILSPTAKALLAEHGHEQWLMPNNTASKQFAILLHEACDKQQHQLSQKEIAGIAKSVIDDVHHIQQSMPIELTQLTESFNQGDHYQILHNLNSCAQKAYITTQFDTSKKGDDFNLLISSSKLMESLSPTQANVLLNSILHHPTSKELFMLLTPSFTMELDLEQASTEYEDQQRIMKQLFQSHGMLAAVMVELDKRAHNSDSVSERLNDWVSYYSQCIRGGESAISASDPEFASAYLKMQATDNQLNLADCGVTAEPDATLTGQYITITDPSNVINALKEIAATVKETHSKQFLDDFNRQTFRVDDVQISRNEDSEMDDMSIMPTEASYFAQQELFAPVLEDLMKEHGISPVGASKSTFNLYNKEDGTIELFAQLEKPLEKMLSLSDGELNLDPDKSSLILEVNLTISKHNNQISANLNAPINVDYRATPA